MDLQEREVGDFRIYAGALDAPQGGYTAAVEVHLVRGGPSDGERLLGSRASVGADVGAVEHAVLLLVRADLDAIAVVLVGIDRLR